MQKKTDTTPSNPAGATPPSIAQLATTGSGEHKQNSEVLGSMATNSEVLESLATNSQILGSKATNLKVADILANKELLITEVPTSL